LNGAVPPIPTTPSWLEAQLKKKSTEENIHGEYMKNLIRGKILRPMRGEKYCNAGNYKTINLRHLLARRYRD